MSKSIQFLRQWHWIVLLVFVSDQLSKIFMSSWLKVGERVGIFPGLNLTLTYNSGAAFSFLADADGWQQYFFIGFAFFMLAVLLIWLYRILKQPKPSRVEIFCIALVVGGALGNLLDRITLGQVIDFIQVYYQHWYWPAFNIADSAICIGAVGLVARTLCGP